MLDDINVIVVFFILQINVTVRYVAVHHPTHLLESWFKEVFKVLKSNTPRDIYEQIEDI